MDAAASPPLTSVGAAAPVSVLQKPFLVAPSPRTEDLLRLAGGQRSGDSAVKHHESQLEDNYWPSRRSVVVFQ